MIHGTIHEKLMQLAFSSYNLSVSFVQCLFYVFYIIIPPNIVSDAFKKNIFQL